jgi:hypothetical protein
MSSFLSEDKKSKQAKNEEVNSSSFSGMDVSRYFFK